MAFMRYPTIMRTILISLCLATVLFAWGQTPSVAFASPQSINYVPLAPIDVPGSELKSTGDAAVTKCQAPTCFPRYLRTLYNVGIALAGLFAVVSIVRGGFELMFTDSILKRSEGKGIILRALGGLVIVYSSYILMNAINPALGRDLDLALQFPRVNPTPTPTPLTVVTAADVEAALNDKIDAGIAERQTLRKQAEAKLKLAAEKRAAAAAPGLTDAVRNELEAEADILQAEAATLNAQAELSGSVDHSSGMIQKARMEALAVLWDPGYNARYIVLGKPILTASRSERITRAGQLIEEMEAQRPDILKISDETKRNVLLDELDKTEAEIARDIRYFTYNCDRVTGLRTINKGLSSELVIPCGPYP